MSSPEERAKRRTRFHNRIAKDLRTEKYRQRVKENKKKKALNVKELSHADLVRLINEESEGDA